jgi:hypothetical protein
MPPVQTNTSLREQGLRILARMIAQRICHGARFVGGEPNGPKGAAVRPTAPQRRATRISASESEEKTEQGSGDHS